MTLEQFLNEADESTWITLCGDLSFGRIQAKAEEFTAFLRPKFLERRVDSFKATGLNEIMVWIADGDMVDEEDELEKEGV